MNKKNFISLVSSGLLVTAAVTYICLPINTLPGTYSSFKEKYVLAQDLKIEKERYALDMNKLKTELLEKEQELDQVKKVADKSKQMFQELLEKQKNEGDWSLHIPSLLIELENGAVERGVNIAIDYSTINKEGKNVSTSGQGLKVITAKVDISGKYHNVKDYIKYVEDIDFLSVEDLILKKSNDKLIGTYYLNIYYLEK